MFKQGILFGLVAICLVFCVAAQEATTTSTSETTTSETTTTSHATISTTTAAATATTGGPGVVVTQNITITAHIDYTSVNGSAISNDGIAGDVANYAKLPSSDVNVTSSSENITIILYYRNSTAIPIETNTTNPQAQVNYYIAATQALINSQSPTWLSYYGIQISSTSINGTYYATTVTTTTSGGHSLTSGASTHLITGSISSTTNHTSSSPPLAKPALPTSFMVAVTGLVSFVCSSFLF
jgi:hypothetical protein